MDTVQDQHRLRPLSPSPSSVSNSQGNCDTQVPSDIKDALLKRGISSERADDFNSRYNRRSIPIMNDEIFFDHLNEIATDNVPDEVETELEALMARESARLADDYFDAKFDIFLAGVNVFPSESQKFQFGTSLRQHSIHGFEGFVAYCLPHLIETCKNKRGRQRRPPKRPEHNRRLKSEASKSSSQHPRRSSRFSLDSPRRSRRLQRQEPAVVG